MLVEPANTLLLDEPTNHLDPASVDMLTDALAEFPGTIIFISHDPTFLARIATRVVEIEEGQARNFIGDYEYYLWKKTQEFESIKETSDELERASPRTSSGPTRAMEQQVLPKGRGGERRDLTKTQARLEKQVSRAETEISEAEEKISTREAELADPKLYEQFDRWNLLQNEQREWKRDLERLTARWESLSAELENVKQQLVSLG
jgi:ATP-binding cassette subfamily F protein 3